MNEQDANKLRQKADDAAKKLVQSQQAVLEKMKRTNVIAKLYKKD